MGLPAARMGDFVLQTGPHCHAPMPHPPMPLAIVAGAPTVLIGKKPAGLSDGVDRMSESLRYRIFVVASVFIASAAAAAPAPSSKTNAPTAPAAAVALPQQTTATFGDWTLRCSRPTGAAKFCELAQAVQRDGKAVAEMAIGATGPGQRLQFTLLVPTSVSFATAPVLTPPSGDSAGLSLNWRRCLPGGCFADAEIGEDALSRMRAWTQPARVVFTDGGGRTTTIPVSPLGMSQALDALAKEDAG